MENKKGNGIFLGIVSVATLIVAIIGATFAYFSASTTSNNGAVGATAYEYSLSLSVNPIYPEGASALIPMDADAPVLMDVDKDGEIEEGEVYDGTNNTNLLYALNEAQKKCIDDHGLQVCALYEVIIENTAVNAITLNGKLLTTKNEAAEKEGRTPFKNLKYQALDGDHETFTLETVGAAKQIDTLTTGEGVDIADIVIPGATKNEDDELEPGVGKSYVLIYLDEAEDDNVSEMGASFEGKLEYTSGDGNTLTGSFTVTVSENQP